MNNAAAELASVQQWQDDGRRFEFSGHEIYWREAGEGPALLLIHGFPTSSWDWRALWSRFGERYRVICLDLLGFGFSEKPRGHRYSIAEQADLIEALLAARRVTHCHVLAHDYGVTVAQELLARQRDGEREAVIDSVCFLNGGLFPEAQRPLTVQKLLASPIGPLIAKLVTRKRFEKSMRAIFAAQRPPGAEELAGFWRLIERGNGRAALPGIIRYLGERVEHRARWVGAMRAAHVPMRFVCGMADPVSGARMAARYRELIAHPDVVELATVGHYPQIEVPDEIHGALLEFHLRAARNSASGIHRL